MFGPVFLFMSPFLFQKPNMIHFSVVQFQFFIPVQAFTAQKTQSKIDPSVDTDQAVH